ncbi:hypothetical protein [Agrobacterium deltaense]|uniref:hypothetical protein n=1 Tax=Agrobacterium deltaense TaxID=1183412 RepID=UPI0009B977AC|nr:hypothetical protein [Agrobacterium deltaense]CUX19908.1 hypothetical protein AGR7B_Cc210024 [Agrobacterium deltaense RV3]
MTYPRPQTLSFIDRGGRKVLKVPLDKTGRAYAKILESDYQRLLRMGSNGVLTGHVVEGKKYVRTHVWADDGSRRQEMAARLLVGKPKGGLIRYVDGDPTDLTPENILYINNRRKK